MNLTVGVGKTTIVEAISQQLASADEPHAWVDLDALSECWPPPNDDPFNTRLVTTNLRCVAENFADAGATTLLLAGVVETPSTVRGYETALDRAVTIVRLTASPEVIESRLRRRHGGHDLDGLQWHLGRAAGLDAILRDSAVPSLEVENVGAPADVALSVLQAVGW